MQNLDLSLEIPGAPIVNRLTPEDDHEIDLDQSHPIDSMKNSYHPPHATENVRIPSMNQYGVPSDTEPFIHRSKWSKESDESDQNFIHQQLHEAMARLKEPGSLEVASAATLVGEINCHSIHVKGELNGALSSGGVVLIDSDAVLKGMIKNAEFVVVLGTVTARANEVAIRCHGLVILAASAKVIGHIQCRSVAIFEGTCLLGTVQSIPSDHAKRPSVQATLDNFSGPTVLH